MPNKPGTTHQHLKTSLLTGPNDPLEQMLRYYIQDFIASNAAAKVVADGMRVIGIGFRPIIDHITFRTLDVDTKAKEFIKHGYKYDSGLGVIEYKNWWAKVYRKAGYPAIFIDQAYEGKKGKGSEIPDWVNTFGDQILYQVTLQVDDIEQAVFFLEKQGVPMMGSIVGDRGSDLRQIFTKPETKKKKPFTVLELAERHRGYQGFLPPQNKA
jgi:hypothetical protein